MLHTVGKGPIVTIYPTQKTKLLGFDEGSGRIKTEVPHLTSGRTYLLYPVRAAAFLQGILTVGGRADIFDVNMYY